MKLIMPFIMWVCLSNSLLAQNFEVAPNPAFVEGVADGLPLIAYADMINNTNESQTVIWERIVEDLPQGWTSGVCTSQGCALTDVNLGEFSMIPGEGLNVDIQFNTNQIPGSGMAKVKLYFQSDSTETVTVTYYGDAIASVVLENQKNDLTLYPNPAEKFFQIKNGKNVHQIKIINIFGTPALKLNYTQDEIDVGNLLSGTYFVMLFDEEELLLQIVPLVIF